MLSPARRMYGTVVEASDGKVGKLIDLLFDDQKWGVTQLVLDSGTWLNRRRVTLPPDIIEEKDWADHRISVTGLTRQQVIDSPGTETHVPINVHERAEEAMIVDWGVYWTSVVGTEPPWRVSEDPHLRNTQEITGYRIHAADGQIGHVADFLVDDETWTIRHLVVDTRNWWPGKHVLIAPVHVEALDGCNRVVRLGLSRDVIRNSPLYEATAPSTSSKGDGPISPGEHGILTM